MLIKKIGDATALEVRATGIQYVFAPCIAVMLMIPFLLHQVKVLTFIKCPNMLVAFFFHRCAEILDGGVAMKVTVRTLRLLKQ